MYSVFYIVEAFRLKLIFRSGMEAYLTLTKCFSFRVVYVH